MLLNCSLWRSPKSREVRGADGGYDLRLCGADPFVVARHILVDPPLGAAVAELDSRASASVAATASHLQGTKTLSTFCRRAFFQAAGSGVGGRQHLSQWPYPRWDGRLRIHAPVLSCRALCGLPRAPYRAQHCCPAQRHWKCTFLGLPSYLPSSFHSLVCVFRLLLLDSLLRLYL